MITEPTSVCEGCGENISPGTIVQALNTDWHPKCFRCSSCDRRLDNWYIQNRGRLYCRRDYLAKFKDACNGCSHVISGPVMVAGEHRFHPECFQCCLCQAFIGDGESYALVERSFLYCGECYHKTTDKTPLKHRRQPSTATPVCGVSASRGALSARAPPHLTTPPAVTSEACPVSGSVQALPPCSSISETTFSPQPVTTTTTSSTSSSSAAETTKTSASSSPCVLSVQQPPRRKPHSIQMVSILPSQAARKPDSVSSTTTVTTATTTTTTTSASTVTASPSATLTKLIGETIGTPGGDLQNTQQLQQQMMRLHHHQNRQHRRSQHRLHQQAQQQQQEQLQQQLRHGSASPAAVSPTDEYKVVRRPNSSQGESNDGSLHQSEGYDLSPQIHSLHTGCSRRLHLTLLSPSCGDNGQPSGRTIRNSVTRDSSGRSTACVIVDEMWPGSRLEGLEVGDRILEVNGDTIKHKTLEEVSSLLTDSSKPVTVMLERDLSPLRLPKEELEEPISPGSTPTSRPHLLRGGDIVERAEPSQNGDSSAETVLVEDTLVRLRPKSALKAKGHSPSRRRSKSPSPCPSTRQKSIDLSRSHSFTTHGQQQKVFRATDLILGELLGQGFFGQAIKAVHRVTGEIMVLKELHNFDENAQKSFLREVSMLRNVSHPCVLRFMGVLYRDKKLNLVTEFIDGGTLSALLLDHSKELSWKQRVAFAKDIANGMNYLHSIDIIHRDLNSQNCLVRKDQTVVVADFGLAKICPRHERLELLLSSSPKGTDSGEAALSTIGEGISQPGTTGVASGSRTPRGAMKKKRFSRRKRQTVVGNPYWMAPEMMTKGVYDEKVDVFSFGIIVCETIARVTADPDYLPRSFDFGLNVEAFHKRFCQDMPEPYFMLAVLCSQMEPDQRPSFDKIYMLCEALSLHVEHKMAVPFELQGSTVQFYRRFRVETYGRDFKDIDSTTQADSSAEQVKNADITKEECSGNQQKQRVVDDQNKKIIVEENHCDSHRGCILTELSMDEGSHSGGIGSDNQGHPFRNQMSDCDTSKKSWGEGSRDQRLGSGDQDHSSIQQTSDSVTETSDIRSILGNSPPVVNDLPGSAFQSGSSVETLNESEKISVHVDESALIPQPTCLKVITNSHDDQAYFSCPSSSPPASPSSACPFSSCHVSPDLIAIQVCDIHTVDPNPACSTSALLQEDPLTEQISNLRSKSVSLVDNVASSGTQAQLHKPTSLSLSDVTPISHNCSVSCDSELDRAQQNGSMESGIFAECTPCDSLVLLKPTEIKSPLTVLPLSASLTQNSKHYPYVDVSGCVSLEKLNPGELIVDGASPAIALVNHTDPQPSQLSSVSSAPTITIENLVDSAVCDTESTTLSDC